VRRVARPNRLRDESLDGLSDQVVAFIAKKGLRPAIDIPNHAQPVHRHQGIRHGLKEALEAPSCCPSAKRRDVGSSLVEGISSPFELRQKHEHCQPTMRPNIFPKTCPWWRCGEDHVSDNT